jgi:WD40 repeat protein
MKSFLSKIILFIFSIALSGCSIIQDFTGNNPKTSTSPYLSITLTDKNLVMHFFKYDINSKIMSEVAQVPMTAQYPLSTVDLKNHAVYYSERDSTRCDQLVKLDLENNQKYKLTDDLFAISYIIPVENKIILVGLKKEDMKKGYRYLGLFSFDLESKTLTSWWDENDHDTSVRSLTLNPYTQRLYASIYSWDEQLQKSHKAEREQAPDVVPPVHRIVEYDLNGRLLREIYRAEELIVQFAVSKDGNLAVIKSAPMIFQKRDLFLFNLKTREKELLKIDDNYEAAVEHVLFSPDQKGIYFTAGGRPNGLYYYDFETKQLEKIFSQPDGYINNFLLLN